MKYTFKTQGVCTKQIEFDLIDGKVYNVVFYGGCNGNLKAIARLVDGFTVEEIEQKLKGNICGFKNTSCADQLAIAARKAYNEINS